MSARRRPSAETLVTMELAAAQLRDFKSGKLAWHSHCLAIREWGTPLDNRVRDIFVTAIRELERYAKALSTSSEMRAIAQTERPGFPARAYANMIRDLGAQLEAKERAAKERAKLVQLAAWQCVSPEEATRKAIHNAYENERTKRLEALRRDGVALLPVGTRPAWNGNGVVIQFRRSEPGPFAGGA